MSLLRTSAETTTNKPRAKNWKKNAFQNDTLPWLDWFPWVHYDLSDSLALCQFV